MMTARERVLAAASPGVGRRPDRLPVDLGGSIVTGINAVAYRRLKEHLGLDGGPFRVTQAILMLAEVEPELLARWRIDVVPVSRLEAAPGARLDGGWRLHPLPRGRDG